MSTQRVNRTYAQLDVGDVVFCRSSMPVDAIRYLSITRSTSEARMAARVHPMVIVHKDDNTHVLTGLVTTSKRMNQIQTDKRQYFIQASTLVPNQTGVIIVAGYNRVNAAGNVAVCSVQKSSW